MSVEGVFSPLLWVIVFNKLLSLLEEAGTKVVAYADDVVILLQGKFSLSSNGDSPIHPLKVDG